MEMKHRVFEALLDVVRLEESAPEETDLNWDDPEVIDTFLYQAERGGVAPWCYHNLSRHADFASRHPALIARLKQRFLATLVDSQQKLALYKQVETLLTAHGIEVALLKGMALAFTVYPDEALRPMGDVDLFIPADKVFAARDTLLANGAESAFIPISHWHEKHNAHVRAMRWLPYKSLIELHSKLYATGSRFLPPAFSWEELVVSRTTTRGTFSVLKPPHLVYHLATHLFHDHLMGGVRLGWLLDIALVFEASDNAVRLLHDSMTINPRANKELLQAIGWSARLMSRRVSAELMPHLTEREPFPHYTNFVQSEKVKSRHRVVVIRNFLFTPGLMAKLGGFCHHMFPSFEYMQHYYGVKTRLQLIPGYFKRLIFRKG